MWICINCCLVLGPMKCVVALVITSVVLLATATDTTHAPSKGDFLLLQPCCVIFSCVSILCVSLTLCAGHGLEPKAHSKHGHSTPTHTVPDHAHKVELLLVVFVINFAVVLFVVDCVSKDCLYGWLFCHFKLYLLCVAWNTAIRACGCEFKSEGAHRPRYRRRIRLPSPLHPELCCGYIISCPLHTGSYWHTRTGNEWMQRLLYVVANCFERFLLCVFGCVVVQLLIFACRSSWLPECCHQRWSCCDTIIELVHCTRAKEVLSACCNSLIKLPVFVCESL